MENLQFGLVQNKGGPCGILAVIQAFILKNLLFSRESSGKLNSEAGSSAALPAILKPSRGERERALVETLTQILLNVSRLY